MPLLIELMTGFEDATTSLLMLVVVGYAYSDVEGKIRLIRVMDLLRESTHAVDRPKIE